MSDPGWTGMLNASWTRTAGGPAGFVEPESFEQMDDFDVLGEDLHVYPVVTARGGVDPGPGQDRNGLERDCRHDQV